MRISDWSSDVCSSDLPRPVDRGGADIFGLLVDLLPTIGADDVAQQPAEIADVGILGDRRHGGGCKSRHDGSMLHRNNGMVKGIRSGAAPPDRWACSCEGRKDRKSKRLNSSH